MANTININLGGTLFQIEEDAYMILRDYIQKINNRFRNTDGGPETVEDIESRIAEIFRSRKGSAGIITKETVEYMVSVIGKPEDMYTGDEETRIINSNITKRLYRNPDNKVIAGVSGGLGAYLNTDPVLFRILFILLLLFFGTGFFIYLILWISVPVADTDSKKKEMHGSAYYERRNTINQSGESNNGISEIIRAIGKVFFIIFRTFLIVIGTFFVLFGFISIVAIVMVFVFKYPGTFVIDGVDYTINYFPEILNYIFSPESAKWIVVLLSIVIIMPLIAFIYWGVRMIFWYKAKDRVVNLVALVIWIMSLTALSIMVFNEGIGFAETSSVREVRSFQQKGNTLYIKAGKRINDLQYERKFVFSEEDYSVLIVDSSRNIFINPTRYWFHESEDNLTSIEVRKQSQGKTKHDARTNAESIIYNYEINGDTLYLDEYFKIPSDRKWAGGFVSIDINLPENTRLKFDNSTVKTIINNLHSHDFYEFDEHYEFNESEFNVDHKEDSWIIRDGLLSPFEN
ncbi:MAG TPA: PspC domain-containing protein [Bacteroidales bacterium]|nr:PspC domain-containing protein [Bacteroidales bacterium]